MPTDEAAWLEAGAQEYQAKYNTSASDECEYTTPSQVRQR
jgi:hypothetical protein